VQFHMRDLIDHDFQRIDLREAKRIGAQFRAQYGFNEAWTRLLTEPDGNAKFRKTAEAVVFGLALSPAQMSLLINTCPFSTAQCRNHCVSFAGKGGMDCVQRARQWRTAMLCSAPDAFYTVLRHEVSLALAEYGPQRLRVRLNTFSDIPWENVLPQLFAEDFPTVRFYDYTKWEDRCVHGTNRAAENYRLCFSYSGRDGLSAILRRANDGITQAVVFDAQRGESLPSTFLGIPVIDGDVNDDRYLDVPGWIVGLRAKGSMRHDSGGMIQRAEGAA